MSYYSFDGSVRNKIKMFFLSSLYILLPFLIKDVNFIKYIDIKISIKSKIPLKELINIYKILREKKIIY